MKFLFCPNCHTRIAPPKWLFTANIKTEKGITIQCGAKGCKGKVKFKPEVKDDNTVRDTASAS
jgi:RNase P subunit RPR2